MNELIKNILSSIKTAPLYMQLIILAVLLIGFVAWKVLLSKKDFQDALVYKAKKKLYRITPSGIFQHPIFTRRSFLLHKIETIKFEDVYKTQIFQIFYKTKVETDNKVLREFISEIKGLKSKFYPAMLNLVVRLKAHNDQNIKDEIYKYCEKTLPKSTTVAYTIDCADEIFEFVMFQKGGYSEKRNERINEIYNAIELINTSPIFDSNYEKAYQLYDEIYSSLSNSILHAVELFSDFNGGIATIIKKYKEKSNDDETMRCRV